MSREIVFPVFVNIFIVDDKFPKEQSNSTYVMRALPALATRPTINEQGSHLYFIFYQVEKLSEDLNV